MPFDMEDSHDNGDEHFEIAALAAREATHWTELVIDMVGACKSCALQITIQMLMARLLTGRFDTAQEALEWLDTEYIPPIRDVIKRSMKDAENGRKSDDGTDGTTRGPLH